MVPLRNDSDLDAPGSTNAKDCCVKVQVVKHLIPFWRVRLAEKLIWVKYWFLKRQCWSKQDLVNFLMLSLASRLKCWGAKLGVHYWGEGTMHAGQSGFLKGMAQRWQAEYEWTTQPGSNSKGGGILEEVGWIKTLQKLPAKAAPEPGLQRV